MKFLHIDDSPEDIELCEGLIKRTAHWEFASSPSIRAGVASWRNRTPQIVLIDIGFKGRPENETYDAIREMAHESIVIALSGGEGQDVVNKCRDAGCASFINKSALTDPQAFHDAIMSGIDTNLRRATAGELAPLVAQLSQLSKAVLYGNGEPGLLARTSIVETKIDTMQKSQDGQFQEIRERAERIEQKLGGDNLMIWIRFAVQMTGIILWGFLTYMKVKSHDDALSVTPPGMEQKGE